jgi:hypothetical protein
MLSKSSHLADHRSSCFNSDVTIRLPIVMSEVKIKRLTHSDYTCPFCLHANLQKKASALLEYRVPGTIRVVFA